MQHRRGSGMNTFPARTSTGAPLRCPQRARVGPSGESNGSSGPPPRRDAERGVGGGHMVTPAVVRGFGPRRVTRAHTIRSMVAAGALAVAAAASAGAQGVVIQGSSYAQFLDMRPLVTD